MQCLPRDLQSCPPKQLYALGCDRVKLWRHVREPRLFATLQCDRIGSNGGQSAKGAGQTAGASGIQQVGSEIQIPGVMDVKNQLLRSTAKSPLRGFWYELRI